MSDQNTSKPSAANDVKEKDPKRVAAGKRLGAISKQAKEAKREALRLEREAQQVANNTNQSEGMEADNNYTFVFRRRISCGGSSVLPIPKQRQISESEKITNYPRRTDHPTSQKKV